MQSSAGGSAARVTVPGSERTAMPDAVLRGAIEPSQRATVTLVVRPKAPLPAVPERGGAVMDRAAFAAAHGADPNDLAAVQRFALDHDLLVVQTDAARRTVVLDGTLDALQRAFGTRLGLYECEGRTFRGRTGALTVPAALAAIITGVFGLDDRPQARAHFRRAARPAAAAATSFTPPELAAAYDFPAGADGTGVTIALIELGGGYAAADIDTYFRDLKLPVPAVVSVGVDGGANAPSGPNGADTEVLLDIEVAGAVAPGARIAVYFAPNTDAGFLDAITTAVHDAANAPSIVSISWGGPESSWTAQALKNFDDAFAAAALLGVTVLCASGDNGSTDGVTDGMQHVDFPASSPHAVACGGTSLQLNGTSIARETVWNGGASGGATGGGVSAAFARPAWQAGANVPAAGRGVPDVAGDADPQTGYRVRVDGTATVVGGTSAVAPLYAGLLARINQRAGKPAGFINARLYADPSAFHDIVSGDNGAFSAGPGWDACTGLGSPDGARIAAALGAA